MNVVVSKVGSLMYSVATPFHPFGGAVDIIAVQQQDGSYRSTPWYVRFGKFQGVLRGAEKIVRVEVNGKECNFHMYIDNSGEAYFVREVVPENSGELSGGDGVKGTEDDQVDSGTSGKADTLNRLESYDSSTGEFELRDDHVALGVDRLERTESDCERPFYDFPDDELSEYGSGRFDMDSEVESENLKSEVVLVSVDGHVLTAPISSSERNTEDVDLHTPHIHLGPGKGTEKFIDGESSWARDYLNHFETSTSRVNSTDVSPGNDGEAETLLEDRQANGGHLSNVEVHQDTEKQVTVEQLSSSNTSPEMNKENIFKSCLELPSLAMQQGGTGSVSSQDLDSPEVHGVMEESQDKSPQSISVHENRDLQLTTSANSDELSSSSSSIPGSGHLSDSPAQAESVTTDRETFDKGASSCDSMVYNSSYANGKLEKEFDDATSQLGSTSEEIVASNDVECQKTPLREGNESETKRGLEISLCGSLLHSGMGSQGAEAVFDKHRISEEEFKASAASIVKNENLVIRIQGKYLPWDKAAPIILGMVAYDLEVSINPDDAISVEQEAKNKTGEVEPGVSPTPSGRGWRLWPIPFRRVKTLEHSNSDEVFADSEAGAQLTPRGGQGSPHKHLMRTNVPTSDQIASLNLKEGQNMVTFISFSRVLGAQKVEAHIYLWKWNAKIVISDVDGTITKSDVLGQFMPLVGKDWTHTGIARLFSAIKENGYQLLFLSARAIVQAYLTKTFLFNLKQDGNTLPNGPVVISPDGLFPSLYREVIRRAPHEFKIACLEDIKSLFPPEYNPFYAGFGNRDTDELSYRKIGIPKGKIFIINPKGEVAINNRVDAKSYTSLHTLVHDMFPPTSLSEQSLTADVNDLQEDFNSWNYWKMPLPDIDG